VSRVILPNVMLNTALVAHEIGHNLSAMHCDGIPGCEIMCNTIGSCPAMGTPKNFGPTSRNAICSFTANDPCFDPVPVATVSVFGSGCVGSNSQVPALSALSTPTLGGFFSVRVSSILPGAPATFLLGASMDEWTGVPLPFPLPNAPGCSVLVSVDSTYSGGTADGSGVLTYTFSVPSDPAIAGVENFLQALVADAAANPAGLVVSNGLDFTYGY
jgi:hypothetical protein